MTIRLSDGVTISLVPPVAVTVTPVSVAMQGPPGPQGPGFYSGLGPPLLEDVPVGSTYLDVVAGQFYKLEGSG
jgi:hypothetical protein